MARYVIETQKFADGGWHATISEDGTFLANRDGDTEVEAIAIGLLEAHSEKLPADFPDALVES